MKPKQPATAPSSPAPEEHPTVYVSPMWRMIVHVWLAIHLTALIAAPLTFNTMGAPLPQWLYGLTRPYMDLCFLDHGYAFFAPEVGPNHLVEYRVWQASEAEPKVERFPDLGQQWPRLLYHRDFMLSESLHGRYAPPDLTRDYFPTREAYFQWQADRDMFLRLKQSFADHLQHEYDADRVQLVRIEHRQPHPPEFENGTRLDDTSLYRELPDQPPPSTPLNGEAGQPPRFPFPYAPENVPGGEVTP